MFRWQKPSSNLQKVNAPMPLVDITTRINNRQHSHLHTVWWKPWGHH